MKRAAYSNTIKKDAGRVMSALICLLIALSIFLIGNIRLPSINDDQAIGFPSSNLAPCHDNIDTSPKGDSKSSSHQSDCCAYCSIAHSILRITTPIFESYVTNNLQIFFPLNIIEYSQSNLFYILKLGILSNWSANSPPMKL